MPVSAVHSDSVHDSNHRCYYTCQVCTINSKSTVGNRSLWTRGGLFWISYTCCIYGSVGVKPWNRLVLIVASLTARVERTSKVQGSPLAQPCYIYGFCSSVDYGLQQCFFLFVLYFRIFSFVFFCVFVFCSLSSPTRTLRCTAAAAAWFVCIRKAWWLCLDIFNSMSWHLNFIIFFAGDRAGWERKFMEGKMVYIDHINKVWNSICVPLFDTWRCFY